MNGVALTAPVFDTFSAAMTGAAGGDYPNSGGTTYGTLTASVTGGRAPYTYAWAKSILLVQANGVVNLSSKTTASVTLSGSGANSEIMADISCLITDANNRTCSITYQITAIHGVPPG